ncbi:MAG TPA: phosphopantetheine-binding protein [Candidatus Polarisedimenticolia bacterium]|nr:phosphopantetheine-binding protein [Candidatus Polarisedimenticolia bacterium]
MAGDARALHADLKRFIVRRLRLESIDPESIDSATPLVGGGLDLDSIDLLELVVGLEKEYGIKVADVAEGKRALASVASLADYIAARRQGS